ncbi:OmpA family protein [Holospora curviuscula]|uniref:Outer membrane protein A n=1 Tax=Holospora curviuscula TaxID=1082868 RepID=A0A2S5R7C4_9PROT|nr:OmpA family protein [Holospora curviuscula]PPE03218.1 Outer membrane protein A precursor [Holospora curviuscula]
MSHNSLESSIWPGFVDVLSAMLMVVILVFTMFALSNIYLQYTVQEKEDILKNSQVLFEQQSARWKKDILRARQESQALSQKLKEVEKIDQKELQRLLSVYKTLVEQLDLQEKNLTKVRQHAWRAELGLQEKDKKITLLERRIEVLMEEKIKQLWKSRSEFLEKLRVLLDGRKDVKVVGDRFVFQSEVLFEMGSAKVGPNGQEALRNFAIALKKISASIPQDVNWVLRVDGHTDRYPLRETSRFKSNLELSIARALAVVAFLKEQGIPEHRLVAAGFGEFHPLKAGQFSDKDRRIELILDDKKT